MYSNPEFVTNNQVGKRYSRDRENISTFCLIQFVWVNGLTLKSSEAMVVVLKKLKGQKNTAFECVIYNNVAVALKFD